MTDAGTPDLLTSAVRAVLRPFVRLMLSRRVTLPLAIDSRVSQLTGLRRKDVKRLRALSRLAGAGGDGLFDALVASASRGIRACPVPDEWRRPGRLHLNDAGERVLDTAAFLPQSGFDGKSSYPAPHVGDHAMAAVDNTPGRPAPWLECSVHDRRLSLETVAFRVRASEPGMQTLKAEASRAAAAVPDGGDARRFTFGVCFHASVASGLERC